MEDLENLLETGYAELIKSEGLSQVSDADLEAGLKEKEEKTPPFPTGMQVFDDTNDDFEELADSNEEFGDYEVICASELQSIPA